MKKVSVIIPVYNCENYIDRCLKSLANQTYRDIEILLMVGFCKDDSLKKCLEWQRKDERIVVISRKDSSLGDARNYALKVAKGEYIAYLDADDFYSEDYIEQMIMPLEKDKTIDMTCCGYDRFEEDFFSQKYVPDKTGLINIDFQTYIENISEAAVWLKVFRRKWLLDNHIEMFDGCCEDQSLHFVLASLVKKIYFLPQPLYHYNIGNENSLVRTLKSRMDYADAIEYAINDLEKRGLFRQNRIYFLNRVCYTFQSFLLETNYNEQLILKCKRFLLKYFPETVEEYEARKTEDTHIRGKVIMYGAGADAERFLRKNGTGEISYIVDKNQALHGSYRYGLLVKPVEELYKETEEVSVIVSSSKFYYEMVTELRKNSQKNIFTPKGYFAKKVENMMSMSKPNMLLLNVPTHANIGDHMIAETEKKFFERHFPDYNLVEITNHIYNECHSLIHNILKPEDILVITGGGFLGSLWMDGGEEIVRTIMKEYKERKIVIFPQSIFFENNKDGQAELEISRKIYNECENLILFLREKQSYHRALSIMKKNECCHLVPDIVLSMTKKDFLTGEEIVRNGRGAICLKDCKESRYSAGEKERITIAIKEIYKDVSYISMYADRNIDPKERKDFIADKITEISSYEFVVTDTLHCMITCAIAGTPCIALDNISGKVRGVYEWICHLPYIKFADCIDDLKNVLQDVRKVKDREFVFDYGTFSLELEENVRR